MPPLAILLGRPPRAAGAVPLVGVLVLVGIGTLHAGRLLERYVLPVGEFLRREGVPRPEGVVQQLRGRGLHFYFDMHVAHIRRQHGWLLDVPAPNRLRILTHLQRSSWYLLGTLALPAAGVLYALRDAVADACAALTAPLGDAARAAAQRPWTAQEVLEFLTMTMSLALVWKLSAGYVQRKKTFRVECPRVTFDDVIGMQRAREQVQMYVRFLQSPDVFTRLGARMPKGCLLAGPPGTGKTWLAKAVAGTAGVPFFAASGSDFMDLYVGQGARSVRELFQAARQAAPAVVFIDELDAVGGHRSTMDSSGEHTRTINQLLAEMDGMAVTNVVVFAATNRIDHLDAALLRPGRFDKVVHAEAPSAADRERLFDYYLAPLALVDPDRHHDQDQDLSLHEGEATARAALAKALAALTPDLTPAHISCICNEAALLAAAEDSPCVRLAHLERAIRETKHGVREARPSTRAARPPVPLD